MQYAVRYYSRGGNTKKIGDAIAGAVDVAAKDINSPVDEDVDFLFLGGALYAGKIHDDLRQFIKNLPANGSIGKVVVFGTAMSPSTPYEEIKELLDAKGIPVDERNFHCHGKFLLFHRSHPDYQDIANAVTFAKQFVIDEA